MLKCQLNISVSILQEGRRTKEGEKKKKQEEERKKKKKRKIEKTSDDSLGRKCLGSLLD